MNSRHHFFLLLAAVSLVHLLFFASSQLRPPAPLSDSREYLLAAENVYQQGILYCGELSEPIREELFTRRPPLYPLLLGITAATGARWPSLLMQILFSIFSIIVVTNIFGPYSPLFNHSRKTSGPSIPPPDPSSPHSGSPGTPGNPVKGTHTRGARPGFFYLLLFLFLMATPAQFIYSSRIMADIPFQLILVLMACCVYRYFAPGIQKDNPRSGNRYVWSFFLLLTMAMATKPVLFPFILPVALLSLFLFFRTRHRVWIAALFIPVLWITGYSLYNLNRTGSAQYASIQTANLVNYNLRYYLAATRGNEEAARIVDDLYLQCGTEEDYGERNRCLTTGVRKILMQEPFAYGVHHLKGSMRYFFDPGRFDLATFFQMSSADSPGILNSMTEEGVSGVLRFLKAQGLGWVLMLGVITLFKIFKVTGFLIYLFRERSALPFRIFLAVLVGYLALVTGPLGASRFYLPVEILVTGAAVSGWLMLLSRSRGQKLQV